MWEGHRGAPGWVTDRKPGVWAGRQGNSRSLSDLPVLFTKMAHSTLKGRLSFSPHGGLSLPVC